MSPLKTGRQGGEKSRVRIERPHAGPLPVGARGFRLLHGEG